MQQVCSREEPVQQFPCDKMCLLVQISHTPLYLSFALSFGSFSRDVEVHGADKCGATAAQQARRAQIWLSVSIAMSASSAELP